MSDAYRERTLDRDTMDRLTFARVISGGEAIAFECIAPDAERVAVDAFRRLAEIFETMAAVRAGSRPWQRQAHFRSYAPVGSGGIGAQAGAGEAKHAELGGGFFKRVLTVGHAPYCQKGPRRR